MTTSSTSRPSGTSAQGAASTTSGAASASVSTPPQSAPARVVTSQTSGGDDPFRGSDAPYTIAQATPTCSEAAMKPAGTLPPIATARPLGHISEIQSHLPGGSNIPLNNDASSNGSNNGDLPYVTVMTMAPSAVMSGADADLDDSRFQFLQRTRWMAAIMLAYYLATFFFVQPFLIGAMGIATGFIGYMSARPPVDFRRIKWVRWYVWLNYAMLGLNAWLLVIAFIAIGTSTSTDADSSADDTGSGSSWMADTSSYSDFSTYYSTNLGVYIGVLVGANMVMHLRGLRTAQLLLAELVAVGFAHPIVATAAPV